MLPVKKPIHEYRTLDEIRQRKEELLNEIQQDNTQFTKLWHQVFLKKSENSKGDYIASLVSNGFMAVDAILLVRKLMKGYGFLFGKKKKKEVKPPKEQLFFWVITQISLPHRMPVLHLLADDDLPPYVSRRRDTCESVTYDVPLPFWQRL